MDVLKQPATARPIAAAARRGALRVAHLFAHLGVKLGARSRRVACRGLVLSLLLAGSMPALRAQPQLTEAQAMAAALLNFARYVKWPEQAFASREAPFTFCIAGRDALFSAAAALEGRSLHGRPTQVRRVLGTEDLRGCQLLFIADSEERRQQPMLRALGRDAVLTVGDAGDFIDAGGAIGILIEDGRVRFDINRSALDAARLRANANLLRLARNARVGGQGL